MGRDVRHPLPGPRLVLLVGIVLTAVGRPRGPLCPVERSHRTDEPDALLRRPLQASAQFATPESEPYAFGAPGDEEVKCPLLPGQTHDSATLM